jgi:outer membrane protein TolC
VDASLVKSPSQRLLKRQSVAETTRGYFERARDAGAATAIQANLASGDLLAIRADGVRLDGRLRAARARLNALLGLPPAAEVRLGAAEEPAEPAADAEELVRAALARRPDLAVLLAAYAAAEEDVRLAVARQFPEIAIGTGIAIVPGLFSGFNHAAIEAAIARRAALREEVTVLVHELRGDVWDARLALDESLREVDFLTAEVLPNAEESLRLAGEAFDAGEVTLLEILSLQHALVDARTRTTEARAELRRRRWKLAAASGTLLGERRTEEMEEGGTGS